jgi:hypothetical protein
LTEKVSPLVWDGSERDSSSRGKTPPRWEGGRDEVPLKENVGARTRLTQKCNVFIYVIITVYVEYK